MKNKIMLLQIYIYPTKQHATIQTWYNYETNYSIKPRGGKIGRTLKS